MVETIKRLYKKTGNVEVVTRAVEKKWIEQSDADVILASVD